DVIMDIGAHIGAFSCACIARGAKYIYAYEPDPANYAVALQNARRWIQNQSDVTRNQFPLCMDNLAIWRSDRQPKLTLSPYPTSLGKTGEVDPAAVRTIYDVPSANCCSCIGLDLLLRELPRITLLKLNCGGAE